MPLPNSYAASSKVTGLLQRRGQVPIHDPITGCWHWPKVYFFPPPSPVQKGEFTFTEGGVEEKAVSKGRRLFRCGGAPAPPLLRTTPSPQAPGRCGWCSQSTLCCSPPSCQRALGILQTLPKQAPWDAPGAPASSLCRGSRPPCAPRPALRVARERRKGILHASASNSAILPVSKQKN